MDGDMNDKHWSDGIKGKVAMIGGSVAWATGSCALAQIDMMERRMIEEMQRERFGALFVRPAEEFVGYLTFPPYVQSPAANGVCLQQKRGRNKPTRRPFLQVRTVANNRKCKIDLKDWIRYGRA